jgi:hypothetical protein
MSFRGMFHAGESLFFTLKPGEIPRFARNDAEKLLFNSRNLRVTQGVPGLVRNWMRAILFVRS